MNMKYDDSIMNKMADDLENYLHIITNYVIIEGLSEEEYNKSLKTVKKLIKKLRKGKGDDVFERDRYIELMESGRVRDD